MKDIPKGAYMYKGIFREQQEVCEDGTSWMWGGVADDEGGEEGELRLHCEGSHMLKVSRLYYILHAEKAFFFSFLFFSDDNSGIWFLLKPTEDNDHSTIY